MNLFDLYPFRFAPIYKKKIWGGEKIKTFLKKNVSFSNCGESWEISGLKNNVSYVTNGHLKNKSLNQLIATYKEQLVGKKVFARFGENFPLLIKFIDAKEDLSIQVHPNDLLAKREHDASGKNEMWYILQAEKDARLICGFNQEMDKNTYSKHLKNRTLTSILNTEEVKVGDLFFLPSGRIHAIGGGILLLEIQQASDITYRIYDWERVNDKGKSRELHTELALKAINWSRQKNYQTSYQLPINGTNTMLNCSHFKTSVIHTKNSIRLNYLNRDSFTVYVVTEGKGEMRFSKSTVKLFFGDTFLLPSTLPKFELVPHKTIKIIETCIP